MWDATQMLFVLRMNKKQTETFTITISGCANKEWRVLFKKFILRQLQWIYTNSMDTHKDNLEMVTIGLIMGSL